MTKFDCAVFLLLLKVATALNVKFLETDIVINEESKILGVKVLIEHNTNSNVTFQVIPKTLSQFVTSGLTLPHGINSTTVDPAEEGLDFDGSTHTVFVEPNDRQTKTVNISIINDNVTETDEVFFLVLRVIGVEPLEHMNSDGNVTVVLITPSEQDNTRVSLVAERTCFHESNGTISDVLYLKLNREIESSIEVSLDQSKSIHSSMPNDLVLPTTFSIPPLTLKVYIPFQIIDDNITEGDQNVTIQLKYQRHNLFRVNTTRVTITIKDNDVARIGFSWNGSATHSMEIVEGETGVYCVAILEPHSIESFVRLSLTSLPDLKNTTNIISDLRNTIFFIPPNFQTCFTITKQDNDIMNENEVVKFQLYKDTDEKMIILDPSSLTVTIGDDDGPPMKPVITTVSQSDFNLSISWTAEVSKFKPVDKFIVTVMEFESASSGISRRQTRPFREHETNKTSYIMPVSEDMWYYIQVCASNRNLRNCSREITFSMNVTKVVSLVEEEVKLADPTPLELVNEQSHRGLGRTSFIAVIVGPAVAVVLAVILILTVLVCRCWGERRHYYPSKQEKVVMANNIEMRNYYYRQRSATTSITNEWSQVSPNNYLAQKETKPQLLTLGTPV